MTGILGRGTTQNIATLTTFLCFFVFGRHVGQVEQSSFGSTSSSRSPSTTYRFLWNDASLLWRKKVEVGWFIAIMDEILSGEMGRPWYYHHLGMVFRFDFCVFLSWTSAIYFPTLCLLKFGRSISHLLKILSCTLIINPSHFTYPRFSS